MPLALISDPALVIEEIARMLELVDQIVLDAKADGDEIIVGDADGVDARVIEQCDLLRVPVTVYDPLNRVVTTTSALGTSTTTGYDSMGRVIATTDERGYTTTYAYDLLGHRTVVTDALGYSTRTLYDPLGNVLAVTDPALGARGGATCFVVEKGTEGFAPGKPERSAPHRSPIEVRLNLTE